jgi:hypothetical protein
MTWALLAMALAAPAPAPGASEVMAEIARRGPDAVRDQLYADEGQWAEVVRGVEAGVPEWLAVAEQLKGLHGGVSEELTVAVSRALARSPRTVLPILNVVFDADDVCSLNTLESSLGDEYQAALREVEARRRAVAAVGDPALAAARRECLAFLDELRREVVRNRADWFER